MAVANLAAADFEAQVLDADDTVVVDVWAPWCGPCRQMEPLFEQAAKEQGEYARFFKLNSDENQEIVRSYKVLAIPTMLYFRHGKLVARKSGVQRPDAIAEQVQALAEMDAKEAARNEITGFFRNPLRKLLRRG